VSTRSRLLTRGVLIVVILAALALAVQLTLAQSPGPEGEISEPAPNAADAGVYGGIPIQGRLTDTNDRPIDGYRSITFSLYSGISDVTPVCFDKDYVDVENGLFSTMLGECASAVNGQQLYLGIQVEGDDEMVPREPIYPVPYAFSLRPGAVISATRNNSPLLHVENWSTTGRGIRSYAMSETGSNYAVVGASRSVDGYGGYFYNNGGGTGLYGKVSGETASASYAVHGESTALLGRGVLGESTSTGGGMGVVGMANRGTGVVGDSDQNNGVWGETGEASGNYGLYTEDNLYSANLHTTGATMQVVQNGGSTTLEAGDVVVFSGMGEPAKKGGEPVIQVAAADTTNSTAVAGVVHCRYDVTAVGEPDEPRGVVTPAGPARPGDYLLVVVRGPAQVKANAVGGALQPGDLVATAGAAGIAARAAMVELGGTEIAIPGTVLGKALEPLEEGQGFIHIYVTLQ